MQGSMFTKKWDEVINGASTFVFCQSKNKPAITWPKDWLCISTCTGKTFNRLLLVRIGAPLSKIVRALSRFTSDYVWIDNDVIVIDAKNPALWIGDDGWRIKALEKVTNGRIRLLGKMANLNKKVNKHGG